MHRYGGGVDLIDTARSAGLEVIGVAIHPPLAGTDDEHLAHVTDQLERIDPALDIWVSHLGIDALAMLPTDRRWKLRLGTSLWHGDRESMHLSAQVLEVRSVSAGTRVGYRQMPVESDGYLVMVGAGTANGVHPLDDGRSPFHHRQTRLSLVEPPHMHTSMLFCANDMPRPSIGDWIDVQRPLTWTAIDELDWT